MDPEAERPGAESAPLVGFPAIMSESPLAGPAGCREFSAEPNGTSDGDAIAADRTEDVIGHLFRKKQADPPAAGVLRDGEAADVIADLFRKKQAEPTAAGVLRDGEAEIAAEPENFGPGSEAQPADQPHDRAYLAEPAEPAVPITHALVNAMFGPSTKTSPSESQQRLWSASGKLGRATSAGIVAFHRADVAAYEQAGRYYTTEGENAVEEPVPLAHDLERWLRQICGRRTAEPRSVCAAIADPDRCCRRDIDPATGAVLEPVDYPDTYPRIEPGMDQAMAWRQQTYTSIDRMRCHLAILHCRSAEAAKAAGAGTHLRLVNMGADGWPGPEPDRRPAGRSPAGGGRNAAGSAPYLRPDRGPEPPYDPLPVSEDFFSIAVKESCVMRPATADDLAGVTEIYNHEVTAGTQATDIRPIGVVTFRRIFRNCEIQDLPFVVVVAKEEELDTSVMSDQMRAKYAEFKKWKAEADGAGPHDNSVLGFAYISEIPSAISGSFEAVGRFSAQLRLFVHRDHRRGGIGSALLDRMVTFASTTFRRLGGYQWEYSGKSRVYADTASRGIRIIHRLYVDGYYNLKARKITALDPVPEHEWHGRMLGRYAFKKAAVFAGAGRSRNADWRSRVVYELVARDELEASGPATRDIPFANS